MKKIHIVLVLTENGKHYAEAITIRTGENLKAHFDRYPQMSIAHLCETATEAYTTAAKWNEEYKANGSYWFS